MPARASPVLLWTVLGGLLAYALAGSLVAFIPSEWVIARLGSLSGSGDVSGEITARYNALVERARLTSAILLAGWMLLVWARERLAVALGRGVAAVRAGARAAPGRLRRAGRSAWSAHRAESLLFLGILLAGVALRLHYLGRDIRHDEAWTYVVYARRPVYLTPVLLTDVNHHPLNTLLIQLCVALFGDPVWALRLPAFLFGVGCIPAAFALARSLGGPGAGLIAAALVSGASPLLEFSVNARGYSAVAFCCLVMLWAGLRAIRRGGVSTWPAVVLAGVVGAYANIVMILPGIAAFTWFAILAATEDGRATGLRARAVVLAGVAVIAGTLFLYVPFFTVSGWDAISSSQGIKSRASVVTVLQTLPHFTGDLMRNWSRDVGQVAGWTALAVALAAPLLARSGRWQARGLLLAMMPALVFQFAVVRDPGPPRIWLPFLPVLLVLLAMSLDGVAGRWRPAIAGGLAVALTAVLSTAVLRSGTLLSSNETAYFPGARRVAETLVGMGAADLFVTPGLRGDEIVYYALRNRLVLDTVRTTGVLRWFRAKGAAAAPRPGLVRLLVDRVVPLCSLADCESLVGQIIPLRTEFELITSEPSFEVYAAERK